MKSRLLACLGWLGASAMVNAAPGQVLVVFKVEAADARSGLGQATAATEARLARSVTTQLHDMFPPIDWVTAAPPDGPAATLTASLVQDDSLIPEVSLRWSAKVGNQQLALRNLRAWSIYDGTELDRPFYDANKLVAQFDKKLDAWMHSDKTEDHLQSDFVKLVPLTTRVNVESGEVRAVLIPLSWKDSMLGDGTRFRLEFTGGAPAGQLKVFFGGVTEVRDGPMLGKTRSRLASCLDQGQAVPGDAWNSCVAILVGQGAPPIVLSFEHYEYGEHINGVASNGTASRP